MKSDRERSAAYREAHRERLRVAAAAWRKAHPERARASAAAYRKAHPERVREQKRANYSANLERVRARNREYARTHPEQRRASKRRSKYGLTHDAFLGLFAAQHGACAICGTGLTHASAHVDHDHRTDRVRGLLCSSCNLGLGKFRDSLMALRAAADYLARFPLTESESDLH